MLSLGSDRRNSFKLNLELFLNFVFEAVDFLYFFFPACVFKETVAKHSKVTDFQAWNHS